MAARGRCLFRWSTAGSRATLAEGEGDEVGLRAGDFRHVIGHDHVLVPHLLVHLQDLVEIDVPFVRKGLDEALETGDAEDMELRFHVQAAVLFVGFGLLRFPACVLPRNYAEPSGSRASRRRSPGRIRGRERGSQSIVDIAWAEVEDSGAVVRAKLPQGLVDWPRC